MPYLPGNKDAIEPPHECRCIACHRPLTTGIGYFVIDDDGRSFPAGPTCFKNLTGLPHTAAAILALGTVNEDGVSSEGETTAQQRSPVSRADTRRRTAKENVLLRADILPRKGFTNTDASQFQEFLARQDALTDADISRIETLVSNIVKSDERKSLEQLKWCNTVYVQIQRLLFWEEGYEGTKKRLERLKEPLRANNGLLDNNMSDLMTWSKMAAKISNIPNSIEGLLFNTNQERYNRFMLERKGP